MDRDFFASYSSNQSTSKKINRTAFSFGRCGKSNIGTMKIKTLLLPGDHQKSWKRILAIVWTAQFICAVGFSFGLPFAPFFLQEELGVSQER